MNFNSQLESNPLHRRSSNAWAHQNDSMTGGVWYTQRDGAVYAIVLDWPQSDILQLGSVTLDADSKVFMLGCDDPLKVGAARSRG